MPKTINNTVVTSGYILPNGSFGFWNPVTVGSLGSIDIGAATSAGALYGQGPAIWTVTNFGAITGGPVAGIDLANGGTVVNGGQVSGHFGIKLTGGAGAVTNSGLVTGSGAGTNTGATVAAGVALTSGGGVTNQTGGTITSTGWGVEVYGGTTATLVNSGAIAGTAQAGVFLTGGTVNNQPGGTIGGKYGVELFTGAGSISNAGLITGSGAPGAYLQAGGYVNNRGTIAGYWGIAIKGTNTETVVNSGVIVGSVQSGVYLTGGTVINLSGGQISGVSGVVIRKGAGTVVNSGAIYRGSAAGNAVYLQSGYADRVIVNPGASFYGIVNGGNPVGGVAVSTLELAASYQQGQLTGLGSQFINFARVTLDPGAYWALTGANTLIAGVTFQEQGKLSLNSGTLRDFAATTISSARNNGAEVTVGGGTWVGGAPLVVGAGGGTGLFVVSNGGSAGATGAVAVTLGQDAGASGTLRVTGSLSAFAAAGQMIVGQAGGGAIGVLGKGTLTSAQGVSLGGAAGGSGTISVSGAQSLLSNTGAFLAGDAGVGGLAIQAGGTVLTSAGATIANTAGANGSAVSVLGAGSNWHVAGTLTAGNAGSASLSIGAGGAVFAGALDAAVAALAVGAITVTDPGSHLTIAGNATIGDDGNGVLAIYGGATVTVGGDLTLGSLGDANGALIVSGTGSFLGVAGSLNIGTAQGFGDVTVGTGGFIHAGVINGQGQVVLEGGTLDPAVDILNPGAPQGGAGGVGGVNGSGQGFIINESTIFSRTKGTVTVTGTIVGGGTFLKNGTVQPDAGGPGILQIGTNTTMVLVSPVLNAASTTFQDDLSSPNTYTVNNSVVDVVFDGATGVLQLNAIAGFAGTVTAFQAGDKFVISGGTLSGLSVVNGTTLTVADSGAGAGAGGIDSIIFGAGISAGQFALVNGNTIVAQALCVAAGTRIATGDGEAAVETLRPGDLVRTPAGALRPVRWIGQRAIDAARHPTPREVQPVRIRAGALADRVPKRDLRVSPEHALLLEGGLVPARLLLNGTSIVQETECRFVTWYHLELESHDVLLAEGAAVESYLDTGNRWNFANGGGAMSLHPSFADGQRGRLGRSCAPFWDAASVVEPIWRRLAARGAAAGFGDPWAMATTADPALTVVAGGRVFRPVRAEAGRYVFALPALAGPARLVSRAGEACALRPWIADRRVLGVAVRGISVAQDGTTRAIPVDDPGLVEGWWAAERDASCSWRWTSGDAVLPVTLTSPMVLAVEIGDGGGYAVAA